jgi:diadenosine tetraphosphatase ApaH/serine/threonine PP2A family protein phosphatase
MKLALLSDIHANLQALDACMAHARAQRAQRFVFLGDMVGYGADPCAVVERIMLLTEEGAMVLKGNHDAMALNPPLEVKSANEPELWRYVYDQRAAAASLDAAAAWPGVRYVFGGHVHKQTLYYRGASDDLMVFIPQAGVAVPVPKRRQWLATIGSVGQPRDGNPLAMYALFDTDLAQLTFHRVPYDHHAAAAAIRRAGLPDFFADRLETGR